jgi:hypothetical protein
VTQASWDVHRHRIDGNSIPRSGDAWVDSTRRELESEILTRGTFFEVVDWSKGSAAGAALI